MKVVIQFMFQIGIWIDKESFWYQKVRNCIASDNSTKEEWFIKCIGHSSLQLKLLCCKQRKVYLNEWSALLPLKCVVISTGMVNKVMAVYTNACCRIMSRLQVVICPNYYQSEWLHVTQSIVVYRSKTIS